MNLRQLRDTKQLKAWLAAGETVELRERNRVLGRIEPEQSMRPVGPTPEQLEKHKNVVWPDFAARLKAQFGDRVIPAVEMLIEERENSRY
ncbi:MAG: hypothetical protein ABSG47_09010 [Terracidiphilus sp.]